MLNTIMAQMPFDFTEGLVIAAFVIYAIFLLHLYIFRAIFNIPTFLQLQKTQIKLLREMAKTQGVDAVKVNNIISEIEGWETSTQSSASNTSA